MKPSWMRTAVSASAPVIDRSMSTVTDLSAARAIDGAASPARAVPAARRNVERRLMLCIDGPPGLFGSDPVAVIVAFQELAHPLGARCEEQLVRFAFLDD